MSDTGDLKKMPDWVKFLLAIAVSLATGAVGYGELKAQVGALEQRLSAQEDSSKEERRDVARAMEGVRDSVGAMQLDIARICARVKCKE